MNDYFEITASNGFHDLLKDRFPHPLQQAIMPLIQTRDGLPEIVGTAFAIGHRIALTAAHTFIRDGKPTGDGLRLLYIYGEHGHGGLAGGELPVQRFTYALDTDLAILRFQMPVDTTTGEELTHKSLQLSFGGPRIGDDCAGIAYAPTATLDDSGGTAVFTVEPRLHFSPGIVEDIYPTGRGAMLPGPGFLTNARFDGGMSGGPILVADEVPGIPRVVGIITTGMHQMREAPVTSYGSLIWRAAGLTLPFRDEDSDAEHDRTLLEMADANVISIHARERVRIVTKDNGERQLHYAGPIPGPDTC